LWVKQISWICRFEATAFCRILCDAVPVSHPQDFGDPPQAELCLLIWLRLRGDEKNSLRAQHAAA